MQAFYTKSIPCSSGMKRSWEIERGIKTWARVTWGLHGEGVKLGTLDAMATGMLGEHWAWKLAMTGLLCNQRFGFFTPPDQYFFPLVQTCSTTPQLLHATGSGLVRIPLSHSYHQAGYFLPTNGNFETPRKTYRAKRQGGKKKQKTKKKMYLRPQVWRC